MFKIKKLLNIKNGYIRCYSWNSDRSILSSNVNNNILIYSLNINNNNNDNEEDEEWILEYELCQHDRMVTSLDWSEKNNCILSCSEDKLACYWRYDQATRRWLPRITTVRVSKSCEQLAWSPLGNKFALTTAENTLMILFNTGESDHWLSHRFGPSNSRVRAIAWNPVNNNMLACGNARGELYIYNAYISTVDRLLPNKIGNFQLITKMSDSATDGFIQSIAWSRDGVFLAYSSQASKLTIIQLLSQYEFKIIATIKLPTLPICDMIFKDNSKELIALTFDYQLLKFTYSPTTNQWSITDIVDSGDHLFHPKIRYYHEIDGEQYYSIQSSIDGCLAIISI
ncbi:hypothetical protein PPL_11923 [Heterostelium album PN500]|uniref:Arp2/3 complex 41 kDa subunit n=1 Tax=Heterostelium pallidum (strain ATCC 26659 / Pp 5 / PN500) TaxID=670386 RepID=D3BUV1_HETP5|nr:hypothetical protein PPL_11923 [Heterostelium album PN500]EFA74889.1 hypothetical protein PPL_11923 [Heterostelium album PN500]|eukprot:XP_020427023.1 hypothetical protein PPL_11923 [Heterostelium album PN500]